MPKSPVPFRSPYAIVADQLVESRLKADITQAELARRLSIVQSAVSKVERGGQPLDLIELHKWLAALNEPFIEFVTRFDEQVRAQAAAANTWSSSGRKSDPAPKVPTK